MTVNPPAYFCVFDLVKVTQSVRGKNNSLLFRKSVTLYSFSVPHRHLHGLAVNYIPSPSKRARLLHCTGGSRAPYQDLIFILFSAA